MSLKIQSQLTKSQIKIESNDNHGEQQCQVGNYKIVRSKLFT